MVLGRMTAEIDALPAIGEEHVVVGADARRSTAARASPPPRCTTRTARIVGARRAHLDRGRPGRLPLTPRVSRPAGSSGSMTHADLNDPRNAWWRHAVCYQIYVRSFADSNGDGIGDLPGITARLPHLRDLGVDALWITPFYTSPQHDHGYDVADYSDVDPLFGTLADADAMIATAHDARRPGDRRPGAQPHLRRARLVPGGAGRRAGQPRAGPLPLPRRAAARPASCPRTTGSRSSAARRGPGSTDGQWYLHLFDTTQPDLDWRNPEVGDMFDDVLRFWLDRGVDGFRVDVAHGLSRRRASATRSSAPTRSRVSGASMEHSMVERGAARRADVGPARGARRLPSLAQDPRRVRRRPDGRRRGLDPDRGVDGAASSAPTSCTRPSTSPG